MKCPAQRNAPRPRPAQGRHHTQPHYKARGKQSYFSCISRLFAIFRSILIFESNFYNSMILSPHSL